MLASQVCWHRRVRSYDLLCRQIRMCTIAYLQIVAPAKINACTAVCLRKLGRRGASVFVICVCAPLSVLLILVPGPLRSPSPTSHPSRLRFYKRSPGASRPDAQSAPDRCSSGSLGFAPRPVPFPSWGSPSSPPTPYPPCSPAPYASPPPPPLQELGAAGGGGGIGCEPSVFLSPSFPPSRVAMYDCLETFAPGPRRLYGAVGPGAGLLRRATGSSCFAGLESFAWPQPASLQCRYPSPGLGVGCRRGSGLLFPCVNGGTGGGGSGDPEAGGCAGKSGTGPLNVGASATPLGVCCSI